MPPKNRDVERLILAYGYAFKEQVGSHRHYVHGSTGHKITIVGGAGDEMRIGTLHALLKYARIERPKGW